MSAISAWLMIDSKAKSKKYCLGKIMALIIFLTGCALAMSIFGFGEILIDKFLFSKEFLAADPINQMAPISTINFVLVGLALLVIDFKGQLLRNPTHIFILISLSVVMLAGLGYLYGVIYLYEIAHARYYPIALNSVIAFLLLDLGILLMRPNDGFMKLVLSSGSAGVIMRQLIPLILIVNTLIGWGRFYLQQTGVLNYELLVTLTVTINFFITSIVIWWNARSLWNIDAQKKKADAQLLRHRELLQSIVSSVGEAIIVIDPEYKVLVANKMAAKLIGVEQRALINQNILDYISFLKKDQPLKPGELVKTLKTPGEQMAVIDLLDNISMKNAEGQIFPIAGVIAPLTGNANIKGMVAVFRDISKDRKIDAAKTEFLSLASHQLRTPLSTISWYTEMLQGGDAGPNNEKQKNYLDVIMHANARMIDLVNSLLSVSQLELGNFSLIPQQVNVVNTLKIILEELKGPIMKKKLIVKTHYDREDLTIMADPHHVQIIIQNLLSNAVDYTPSKGALNISITKETRGLLLIIGDSGCGIPKDAQSKIFSKLFRADNIKEVKANGNGLGLYLVKLIVDRMGASIRFDSKENCGTTFYVKLPNRPPKTDQQN
jgi:PAS domain S-box-containing protein